MTTAPPPAPQRFNPRRRAVALPLSYTTSRDTTQRKAIKEICRELKVSRKTVGRVMRRGATEFVYERKV